MPDVPTFAELGYAEINDYTWTTIFAPAGTPAAIVEKMNLAINEVLSLQEFKDKLDTGGLIPVGGTLTETSSYIASEIKRWSQVVKTTGAKPE